MTSKQQVAEVEWYKKNGRHPSRRICIDKNGDEYVVGDFYWNGSGQPFEKIEPYMPIVREDL